jgi:hypothetical protein
MSFREQRNFIEILRNLGYSQTIRCDLLRRARVALLSPSSS